MDSSRCSSFLKQILGIFLLAVGSSSPVWARLDVIPGSRYTSARAAALGDAFLPLGEDAASGLFYNPAVLGRIRSGQIEPFNLSFYGNAQFITVSDPNFYNATSLSSYAPRLRQFPNQNMGIGGAYVASFAFPWIAFGVLAQADLSAKANDDSSLSYRSLYQFVPAIGQGFHLFKGIFRLGYSVQWVNQASGRGTSSETSVGYDQGLQQGSALSANAGASLTLPIPALPTFSFVVRNIMGARFISYAGVKFSSAPNGIPDTEPMTADGSFSLQSRLGRGSTLNLIAEARDITNRSQVAPMGHLGLGMEFDFNRNIYLRGGWRGGYPSIGIGLRRKGSELSFTCYSEEIGTHYLDQADTRYLLQYQIRSF